MSPDHHLSAFLTPYIEMDDETLALIASRFEQHNRKKREFLQRAGTVAGEFVIITKGCTRVFLTDPKGREVSVWFALPGYIGCDIQSFISGQPSKFHIEALTPVEYLAISREAFYALAGTVPAWERFQAKMWGEAVVDIIDRIIQFQYQPAEERYRLLMRNPDYARHIPQKHLASFLGITQTSLSRLRKELATSKKLP